MRKNDRNHNVERNSVQGTVDCVSRDEVIQVSNEMRTVEVPGPSDVSLELIAASREVRN